MASKTKPAVTINMPMMNAAVKSRSVTMPLSAMQSMMGALGGSNPRKATKKPAGRKGRRSK